MIDTGPGSLAQLVVGERGTVLAIAVEQASLSRLAALGFSVGVEVRMLQNARHGSMIVLVRNTRVALGRDVAAGIMVEGRCYGPPQPAC